MCQVHFSSPQITFSIQKQSCHFSSLKICHWVIVVTCHFPVICFLWGSLRMKSERRKQMRKIQIKECHEWQLEWEENAFILCKHRMKRKCFYLVLPFWMRACLAVAVNLNCYSFLDLRVICHFIELVFHLSH